MSRAVDLSSHGLKVKRVLRNAPPAVLYEEALAAGDAQLASSGAMVTRSGAKTGRSPKDKRIVERYPSREKVWWGNVNMPLPDESYPTVRQAAVDYLNGRDTLYVVDGYAGWDPQYQLKVRVVCARPYHALFMHNMLMRPGSEELASFGEPDYVILNAGEAPAPRGVEGVDSETCVCLNFEAGEFVILGTEYAGEMKKGVFTIMHYLMPEQDVFSMHCSANEGAEGDVSLFFGLSGTGKTTLSADPRRKLIGDDEHCWSRDGVFNIEGGCYAKCIGLSAEKEPEIFAAIRYGTVLENTTMDPETRKVDYEDSSITENTRASYPIEYIPNAKLPCVGGHPTNVILLTCDAFGVLPPVSKLSPALAMYHFFSGYTAKVAGTEMGVDEPTATFSACFGAAFSGAASLVLRQYAGPQVGRARLASLAREHRLDGRRLRHGQSHETEIHTSDYRCHSRWPAQRRAHAHRSRLRPARARELPRRAERTPLAARYLGERRGLRRTGSQAGRHVPGECGQIPRCRKPGDHVGRAVRRLGAKSPRLREFSRFFRPLVLEGFCRYIEG